MMMIALMFGPHVNGIWLSAIRAFCKAWEFGRCPACMISGLVVLFYNHVSKINSETITVAHDHGK